jgi:RNA polymerase sigma factor (sigma-70 family)
VTEALDQISDAELIAAVRAGNGDAFGVLYERHLLAARRAAACLAQTAMEREDLVAEAFTRVLRMLREGRGPEEEFRPYLLVTLRNTAINSKTRGVPMSLYADVPDVSPTEAADDPVINRWHAAVAADAFASLPERWRVVLWHTEVENESPASVAPLLGMRPNSVAALAYRAREGLRQAYLRQHVPEPPRQECRSLMYKLAGYVRHGIPLPLYRKIDKHLAGCAGCRNRVQALRAVNDELRGLLGPVVLGAPLAAAYLPAKAAVGGAFSLPGLLAGLGGAASALSGAVVAIATDVAATTVSGFLAIKASVVQVTTALAFAATAATVTASSPTTPVGHDERPVAVAPSAVSCVLSVAHGTAHGGLHGFLPNPAAHRTAGNGSATTGSATHGTAAPAHIPTTSSTSTGSSTTENASTTKAQRKAAKKAAKAAKGQEVTQPADAPATKDKHEKKPKKSKKHKKAEKK